MTNQRSPNEQDSPQTPWAFTSKDQRDATGTVLSRLPPQTGAEDPQSAEVDEPYFPTVDEAVDLNKQAIGDYHHIFGDSPEWGGVLKPNELESAIGSARNHYAYDPEPDDAARYAQAAAKQAWRIAGSQVFANGNKRTAYGLTQHMLDQNGLGHLSPVDQPDPEFVDHLIAQDSYGGEGVPPEELPAQRQRLEDEYLNMWKQRYAQGGPTPNYQQRYPEGTYIGDPQEAQAQNLQGLARTANILDEIHADLDPRVWDNPASAKPVLKSVHAHWIKAQIYKTLEDAGYTDVEQWLTLVLTGSLTTYQFSSESDCDVSLFVDSRIFPEWSRAEMIAVMVEKLDGKLLPGTPHPMQNFVVGEGIKPSDLYKPGLRSGYNLDNGKWIVPPERDRAHDVKSEEAGFYVDALLHADRMETLMKYEPEKAIQLWHMMHRRRQRDMKAGRGDFTSSNIAYKLLSQRGLFPKLSALTGEHIA